MNLPELFKEYLLLKGASKITAKNYVSDVRAFIAWFEKTFKTSFNAGAVSLTVIEEYITQASKFTRSNKRYLSSLRRFFSFLKEANAITTSPFDKAPEENIESEVDLWEVKEFKNFLFTKGNSHLTIKNYIIDIKSFIGWYEKTIGPLTSIKDINPGILYEYRQRLVHASNFAPRSVNRKLSSLRRYIAYVQGQAPTIEQTEIGIAKPATGGIKLENIAEENKPDTRSKIAPVRLASPIFTLYSRFEEKTAEKIIKLLKTTNTPSFGLISKSFRKFSTKRQAQMPIIRNVEKQFYAAHMVSTQSYPLHRKVYHHLRFTRPDWYKRYHNYAFAHYMHFAILVVYASAVGFMLYQGIFAEPRKNPSFAAPAQPLKVYSFQGRLTDANDNPITTSKQVRFMVYNSSSASGAAELWEEVRTISPDTDGIFSVLLASAVNGTNAADCGVMPPGSPVTGACGIPQSLFRDNSQLWLGVTITNDSELTPRQQIATVAYATNAEVLQGLPPITQASAGTTNVVLALDSSGNLTIGGSANPIFSASGGTFTLTGQPLLLKTNASSNGNIQLVPDGLGKIDIQKPIANFSNTGNLSPGAVEIDDKFSVLATESAVAAFIVNNNTAGGDIFSASSSGTPRFTVQNDGTIVSSKYVSQNGVLYGTQTTGVLAQATTASTGLCLLSGASNPGWSACPGGGADLYWNQLNGSLFANNSTVDFLAGGQSTGSAAFRVTGQANPFRGTLSAASVSANTSFAGFVTDNKGVGDLFAASSSGVPSFVVKNNGDLVVGSSGQGKITAAVIDPYLVQNQKTTGTTTLTLQTMGGAGADIIFQNQSTDLLHILQTGNVGIGVTNPTAAKLQVGGSVQVAGNINADTTGRIIGSAGTPFDSVFANNMITTGAISGFWQQGSGSLFPLNSTLDFLLGGQSTASAKFAFINLNSGNPTATISGNLSLVTPTGNAPAAKLNILNNGSFDIQNSVGGNAGLTTILRVKDRGVQIGGTDNTLTGPSLAVGTSNAIGTDGGAAVGSSNTLTASIDAFAVGFQNTLSGIGRSVAFGRGNSVSSQNSGAFGLNNTVSGNDSFAIGENLTAGTAVNTIVLGLGVSTTDRLVNNTANSLMVGFNSTVPTLYVGPASGIGTYGLVGIGTSSPRSLLHVEGNSSGGNAALIINQTGVSTNDILTASASGISKFTISNTGAITSAAYTNAGGLLYTATTGLIGQTGVGTGSQCLLGGTIPTWGSCAAGGTDSPFQVLSGAIVPNNSTEDFLIGGQATLSAKFAVLNVNSGTPTASVSATSTGAGLALGGDGTIQALRNNTLTIGGATTGNILFKPNNNSINLYLSGANVAIGNQSPQASLDVSQSSLISSVVNKIVFGSVGNTIGVLGYDGAANNEIRMGAQSNVGLELVTNDTVKAYISNTGNFGVGTITPTALLDVGGTASVSGALKIYGTPTIQSTANQTLTLGGDTTGGITLSPNNGSGWLRFSNLTTNGGVLYTNGSGVLSQSAGTASQCLIGGTPPTWGSCLTGVTADVFWNQSNGLLYPGNSTVDFAIGGQSTSSAKFAVLNVNGSTSPVASISATTASGGSGSGIAIGGDGTIQALRNNTLTIGGATTGDILLSGRNGANNGVRLNGYSTGLLHSDTTGRITSSAVDLSSADVTNYLSFANGGSPFKQDGTTKTIYPLNSTVDFLLGGQATLSAQFSVLGLAAGTNPTASISAVAGSSLGNGIVLAGNGSIQGLRNNTLTIGGATTGNIVLSPLNGSGTLTLSNLTTNGGVLYTNGSGVLSQSAGTASQCLIGGTPPTWGNCGTGTTGANIFQQNSGLIFPNNSTVDFAIGGQATLSAKFAVLNVNGTGPATATVSGNIIVMPINGAGGNVGIGTTNPTQRLEVNGGILAAAGSGAGFRLPASSAPTQQIWSNGNDMNISPYFDALFAPADSSGRFRPANNNTSDLGTLGQRWKNFWIGGSASISANLAFDGAATAHILNIFDNGTLNIQRSPGGDAGLISALFIQTNGSIGLGNNTAPGATLDITGTLKTSSTVTFSSFTSNGGPLYTNGSGVLSQVTAGTSSQCLLGGTTPSFGSCNTGVTTDLYWNQLNGSLFANNSTVDFFIGGQATTSAKFAVLNSNGSTSPVASISATTASGGSGSGIAIGGDGTIQALRNNSLTIGGATTGDILFKPNNTSSNLKLNINISDLTLTPSTGSLGLNGHLFPTADNTWTLGTSSNAWGTVYTYFVNSRSGQDLGISASSGIVNISSTLNLSGVTNDITTGTNQNLAIMPNGTGKVGISTTTPTALLDVAGTASISGALKLYGTPAIQSTANQTLTLGGDTTGGITLSPNNGSGWLRFANFSSNGGVLYTNGSGILAQATAGTSDQCLLGGASPSFGSCSTGTTGANIFQQGSGAIFPNNSTLDFLIGGQATTSAKFALLNINSGTPTASISANSGNNALYLTGDGTLATTNRGTITIGNSSTYNTSGNVLINPNGTGNVGIGTIAPTAKLDVSGTASVSGALKLYGTPAIQSTAKQTLTLGGDTTGNIVLLPAGGTGGKVVIGASNPYPSGNITSAKLQLDDDSGNNSDIFQRVAGTGWGTYYQGASSGTLSSPTIVASGRTLGTHDFYGFDGNDFQQAASIRGAVDAAPGANSMPGRLTFLTTPSNSTSATERLRITSAGNIGIGTTAPISELHITRPISFGATGKSLAIFDQTESQDIFTASASGTPIFSITNAGGIKLGTSVGTGSQCITGGTTAAWGTCGSGGGSSNWVLSSANGTLSPINNTLDLLIGGTSTASAEFSVLNIAGGTPTASVSATATGTGLSLGGDGTIQALRNNTLTIGGATTGNISLNPLNGLGLISIGKQFAPLNTLMPDPKFQIYSTLGTSPAASISARSSTAPALLVTNDGTGDLIVASSAGSTVFRLTNNVNAASVLYLPAGSKLTGPTVYDPLYDIDGTGYATFLPGMPGLKEEVTGRVTTSYDSALHAYAQVINLDNQSIGSDLWVFSRTIDRDINLISALLTPESSARTWYVKDPTTRSIIVYSDRPTEVSYRFTAPRFDHHKYPTNENIADPAEFRYHTPAMPSDINTGPVQITEDTYWTSLNIILNNGAWTLVDSLSNQFIRAEAFSQAKIAQLTAGYISAQALTVAGLINAQQTITNSLISATANIQQLTANSLGVTTDSVTIAGKSLRDYIVQTISNSSLVISNSGGIVSPVASIDQIHTNLLSPLAGTDITLKGNLNIKDSNNKTIARIDASGNATFSGQLISNSVQTNTATVSGALASDSIQTNNASISGTLAAGHIVADSITANSIEGLEARVATLAANFITSVSNPSSTNQSGSIFGNLVPGINTNYVDISSFSAQFGTITDGLIALGPTTLNQVTVMDSISIGTNMTIGPNSINLLGGDLEIQPLKQGGISFLAGLVHIDTEGNLDVAGNATFAKDVTVKGNLAANIISPLGSQDLGISLPNSQLQIRNASGSGVLAINNSGDLISSGAATFNKLNLSFAPPVYAADLATATASGSAGTAFIKQGHTELTIENPNVTDKSLIYITPVGQNTQVYLLRQVANQPGIARGSFSVGTPLPVIQDLQFNWIIVN